MIELVKKILDIIKLIRVKHWIKNVLIFLPIFFSGTFLSNLNQNSIIIYTIGFLSFSFISSAIYVFNDINDIDKDKKHPIKKNRPLAAGRITKSEGWIIFSMLFIFSFILNVYVCKTNDNYYSLLCLATYFLLNILYSIKLKNIPIIDVTILMSGFVLRMIYGAIITNIAISNFLLLTVMSCSYYLGFSKRRNELIKNGSDSRNVLQKYKFDYLDKFTYFFLLFTIVLYCMWCIDSLTLIHIGNNYVIYSVFIILLVVMKYQLNIENDSFGDPVDVITNDKILILLCLVYVITMFIIIYII